MKNLIKIMNVLGGFAGGMVILLCVEFVMRLISPEAKFISILGFPDGWTEGFSDTQRYKMMGNAVTVNVVEAIVNKLS